MILLSHMILLNNVLLRFAPVNLSFVFADVDAALVGLGLSYAFMLFSLFQWCVRQSAQVENMVSTVFQVVSF